MSQQIGNMIYALRTARGISQKELARGILSVPELSRIERAGKEEDTIILESLFQRLGKSIDKLEMAIPDMEYKVILLRTLILENLLEGNEDFLKHFIQEYEESAESKKTIHQQYLLKIKAVASYVKKKDAKRCLENLEEALKITFPEWKKDDWGGICLCTQELQLLLMIAYLKLDQAQEEASRMLQKIYAYIETCYTDEEEKARIYPQCLWMSARLYLQQDKMEIACQICDEGIDCLTRNGVLTLLDEFLFMKQQSMQLSEAAPERISMERQRSAIRYAYEMAEDKILSQDEIFYFIRVVPNNELLISNEMIRELRIALNMSQEELIEDICTRETLSRIESGKRSPNHKNFEKLLRRLDVEPDSYRGFIYTEDYELLEKARNFNRNWFSVDTKKAYILLNELEEKLDMNLMVNKQYIANARIMEKIQKKEVTYEQAFDELEQILGYTMKKYKPEVYRIPSRTECAILNHMALCSKWMGNKERARRIYEQILAQYAKSHVDEIHHAVSKLLIYMNFAALLSESDDLEKAEEIGKRGIRLAIKCERGDAIGILLANLSCVYETRNLPEDERRLKINMPNSYYFLDLFGHKHNARIVKEYCEETIGIQL